MKMYKALYVKRRSIIPIISKVLAENKKEAEQLFREKGAYIIARIIQTNKHKDILW